MSPNLEPERDFLEPDLDLDADLDLAGEPSSLPPSPPPSEEDVDAMRLRLGFSSPESSEPELFPNPCPPPPSSSLAILKRLLPSSESSSELETMALDTIFRLPNFPPASSSIAFFFFSFFSEESKIKNEVLGFGISSTMLFNACEDCF